MPSTRRAVLTATLAISAGCTEFGRSTDTPTESNSDQPDDTQRNPGDSEFIHWRYDTSHEELGMLSLGGGPESPAIFVGSATNEAESETHKLHALTLQNGEEQWSIAVPNPVQSAPRFAGTSESPRTVFATGNESLQGDHSQVHGVNHDTGEEVWQFDTSDGHFLHPFEATEERVYVGSRDDQPDVSGEYVYGVAASDGDQLWRSETGDISREGNARRRDSLLVTTARGLEVMDLSTGEPQWETDADSVSFDNSSERVFVQTEETLRGLSLTDGSELWRREFDFDITQFTTPRSAMDETVFVGDVEGRVHAISPVGGETRWTLSIADGPYEPIAKRTSELLYLGGAGVHAINPTSGEREWSFTPDADSATNVYPSTSVFASTDDKLWALDTETGEPRWEFTRGSKFAGVANAGNFAFVALDGVAFALDGTKSA